MNEKDSKTLETVSETLQTILAEIRKPRNIILRILDITAAGVGVLGITSIAEQVMKWILGG